MPTPAAEILAKAIMPTGLSSAELRDTVAPEIRRRSFFSARTAEAEYLEEARRVCDYQSVRAGSGSSAVGYLYDRVSGTLFGNAGTGAFTIGPDKT